MLFFPPNLNPGIIFRKIIFDGAQILRPPLSDIVMQLESFINGCLPACPECMKQALLETPKSSHRLAATACLVK